jgi:hypothetical protein
VCSTGRVEILPDVVKEVRHSRRAWTGRRSLSAAALRLRERFRGKRLALVLSGGNISPAQLADLFA